MIDHTATIVDILSNLCTAGGYPDYPNVDNLAEDNSTCAFVKHRSGGVEMQGAESEIFTIELTAPTQVELETLATMLQQYSSKYTPNGFTSPASFSYGIISEALDDMVFNTYAYEPRPPFIVDTDILDFDDFDYVYANQVVATLLRFSFDDQIYADIIKSVKLKLTATAYQVNGSVIIHRINISSFTTALRDQYLAWQSYVPIPVDEIGQTYAHTDWVNETTYEIDITDLIKDKSLTSNTIGLIIGKVNYNDPGFMGFLNFDTAGTTDLTKRAQLVIEYERSVIFLNFKPERKVFKNSAWYMTMLCEARWRHE